MNNEFAMATAQVSDLLSGLTRLEELGDRLELCGASGEVVVLRRGAGPGPATRDRIRCGVTLALHAFL